MYLPYLTIPYYGLPHLTNPYQVSSAEIEARASEQDILFIETSAKEVSLTITLTAHRSPLTTHLSPS